MNNNTMPDKNDQNWRKMTFEQREGYAPLPEPLQVGKLSKRFRNRLWLVIDKSYNHEHYKTKTWFWDRLVRYQLSKRFEIPHDSPDIDEVLSFSDEYLDAEFPPYMGTPAYTPEQCILRDTILEGKVPEILGTLELALRHPDIPDGLADAIEACFSGPEGAPYVIDRSAEPVCIFPVSSEENRDAVVRALDSINASDLTGAKTHLREAAVALNGGDFAGCVRESISAVESAVHEITPGKSKNFATALASLKDEGVNMHRALQQALKNLYGYASDEPGIRHGLKGKDAAEVGLPEALLMYSACVAFVDYLRARKM